MYLIISLHVPQKADCYDYNFYKYGINHNALCIMTHKLVIKIYVLIVNVTRNIQDQTFILVQRG